MDPITGMVLGGLGIYAYMKNKQSKKQQAELINLYNQRINPFDAVNDGKILALKEYLTKGGNPNIYNSFGNLLLSEAIERHNLDMINLLLDNGADASMHELGENKRLEETALQRFLLHADFCFGNTIEFVKTLKKMLTWGSIHEKDHSKETILHYAARYACDEVLDEIIKFSSFLHEKNCVGHTALYILQERDRQLGTKFINKYASIIEKV